MYLGLTWGENSSRGGLFLEVLDLCIGAGNFGGVIRCHCSLHDGSCVGLNDFIEEGAHQIGSSSA